MTEFFTMKIRNSIIIFPRTSIMAKVCLSLRAVRSAAFDKLRGAGLNAASATAIADTIAAAERDGCKSHGLFRLPGSVVL